ncbi:MAG: glutathionylspermidine synthase family protein [Gemmatimonadaceae bacterium]
MTAPATPWLPAAPLAPDELARLRRRAIFDCCKWDPQVEDGAALADAPLVLRAGAWRELAALAELLAAETLAAEEELVGRPELHAALGLPPAWWGGGRGAAAAELAHAGRRPPVSAARLIRFDFHHTRDGWRISEANTDVPGGLNEASGIARLVASHYPGAEPVGDTAGLYARALVASGRPSPHVALVHATAYTDDRQVMTYLARRLEELGASATLASPANLQWRGGRAHIAADWRSGPVDLVMRFFPAEWLPNLPRACGWSAFFHGAITPMSNPATALLTQSKRFPLVWSALRTPLPTWRALLPETRDPRDVPWRDAARGDDWVLKPALGRVGEDIAMRGVTGEKEWRTLAREARRHPRDWVAQRRFEATPLENACGVPVYPCVGVYTVGTQVAGAYGRLAPKPLIDWRAQDVAVLAAA